MMGLESTEKHGRNVYAANPSVSETIIGRLQSEV